MSKEWVRMRDDVQAGFAALLSFWALQSPDSELAAWLFGDRPGHWQDPGTLWSEMHGAVLVPGNERSGCCPGQHVSAAVVATPDTVLYEHARQLGGRPALARAVGTTLVARVLPSPGRLPRPAPGRENLLLVSIGQGRRARGATFGTLYPDQSRQGLPSFVETCAPVQLVAENVPLDKVARSYPDAVRFDPGPA